MGRILLLIILMWNISCGSSSYDQKKTNVVDKDYSKLLDDIVKTKWGKSYATKENKKRTYVIVSRKTKTFNNLFPDIDFFVFDYEKQVIIWEDHLEQGSLSWVSENTIIAVSTHIESNVVNKTKYHFNVETGIKKTLD